MRARVMWLMVPTLVLVGVACGGSDSASGDAWCDLARKLDDTETATDGVDFTDPDAIKTVYTDLRDQISDAVKAAPDEIKDEVETFKDGIGTLYDELKKVDFDILKLDGSALDGIDDEMTAAADAIEEYNATECGIVRSDTDGAVVPEEDTGAGSSDLGSVVPGELPSDIGDLIGQQLESLGLTDEEASCIADKFSSEQLDANGDPDITAMFGVFQECGIDVTRLAELGG